MCAPQSNGPKAIKHRANLRKTFNPSTPKPDGPVDQTGRSPAWQARSRWPVMREVPGSSPGRSTMIVEFFGFLFFKARSLPVA